MLLSLVSQKLHFINAFVTSAIKCLKEVPVIGIEIPLFFVKFKKIYLECFYSLKMSGYLKKILSYDKKLVDRKSINLSLSAIGDWLVYAVSECKCMDLT